MFRSERGLRPRNRFLGEPSEGAVEAPSDRTSQMGPYHRSSLLDHHEGVAGVDGLPHLDGDLPDAAGHRRPELVLHLHRLEHDEPVPGMHRLADLDLDVHDLAGHRRLEHLATRRGLAAAGADDVPGLLLDADMIALAVHLDDGDAVLVAHVDHVRHAVDQERPDALRRLPAVDLAALVADGDAVPAVRSGHLDGDRLPAELGLELHRPLQPGRVTWRHAPGPGGAGAGARWPARS